MNLSESYGLVLALVFALAAGFVGCFALMRRMLLASDVISHLALPGLGIAFLLKLNPLAGAAATLFLGTVLIWRLQGRTGLATEAAIGVVFAAALAIGAAVTPREDLVEALFGTLPELSLGGFLLGLAAVASVIIGILLLKDRLILSLFSPDLAAVTGVKVSRLELYFLLLFSLLILAGLRFMGALLASGLIIIPASTARQLTGNMASFLWISPLVSLLSVLVGYGFATAVLKTPTVAPTIVVVSALVFGATLLGKRASGSN
jgi:ABC-type Mn2+/Zn2+ transport system permease subunit